jgi:hypothetical protein
MNAISVTGRASSRHQHLAASLYFICLAQTGAVPGTTACPGALSIHPKTQVRTSGTEWSKLHAGQVPRTSGRALKPGQHNLIKATPTVTLCRLTICATTRIAEPPFKRDHLALTPISNEPSVDAPGIAAPPHPTMDLGDSNSADGDKHPRELPSDLPTSLDDRRHVRHDFVPETEMYDGWQGSLRCSSSYLPHHHV